MAPDPRRAARTILSRPSAVLATQIVLGLLTVVLAWLTRWEVALVGLVLMQLVTTAAVVAQRTTGQPAPAAGRSGRGLTELEQRVDALGARLLASTERTRVEVLDTLADAQATRQDRNP